MENICFFVPFNSKIPRNKLSTIFMPDIEKIHILLDKFNQFMIPTKD